MPEHYPQGDRRAFLIHGAVFLLVCGGLTAYNLAISPPEGAPRTLWFQWPLLGWGIGVAAHGLVLWLRARGREGGLLADADMRAVTVHLFVYGAVNALLITVNLLETPRTLWFVWPLLGWGAGFAVHAWLAYRNVVRRTAERYATEQRILSEIQLERMAAEIASAVAPEKTDQIEKAPAPKTKRPRRKTASKTKKPAPRKRAPASGGKSSASKTGAKARTPKRSAKKPAPRRKSAAKTNPG